jgi:hypothetical protein
VFVFLNLFRVETKRNIFFVYILCHEKGKNIWKNICFRLKKEKKEKGREIGVKGIEKKAILSFKK